MENLDERFDRLLSEYKNSFGEREASANFTPNLWKKIEGRKNATFGFEKLAQRFVTAAMALCLLMGLFLITPLPQTSSLATYIEVLADEHEVLAYSDVPPADGMLQQ